MTSTIAGDRIPGYFGPDASLYGCFHPVSGSGEAGPVAVLCHPVHQEYLRSHRAFLQLAIRLARSGVPTLRFDYRGTGDSAGDRGGFGLEDWVDDLLEAIDHARTISGRRGVVVGGLRLGATVAELAAQRIDGLEGLALWDPIRSGREYLREARDEQRRFVRFEYVTVVDPDAEERGEVLGYPLGSSFEASLDGLELESGASPAVPTLVIETGAGSPGAAPASAGARLERIRLDGPGIWMEEPNKGLVPNEALGAIVQWVKRVRNG